MRTLIVLTGLAALSACSTHSYNFKPPTTEQSEAIDAACGHRPVSKLRGSRSPREVIYSACRSEALDALLTDQSPADVP
ncbi:hypothetical protein [Hyphomonas sp.]|uniref:hypothetical protein n=1 Tax=Hyphomonas sp. TaxID=87 RepID=UPI0025B8A8E4|nr:hypothetical protein [Hyphomonas sp.]